MGLHEIMHAVRASSAEEQALVIKETIAHFQEGGEKIEAELEALLSARWNAYLSDPTKSRPAGEVLADMLSQAAKA